VISHDIAAATFRKLRITYQPPLPLAMYYELAAHLAQLPGIITELIWQDRQQFDYLDSQIAAIAIESSFNLDCDLFVGIENSGKDLTKKLSLKSASLSFLMADLLSEADIYSKDYAAKELGRSLASHSGADLADVITNDLASDLMPDSSNSKSTDITNNHTTSKLLSLILDLYGNWQIQR
jgi:hypothetical protein